MNTKKNNSKVQFRMSNELYLRDHPELNTMIQVFLFKVLEEKPQNILSYAGKFFDQFFIILIFKFLNYFLTIEKLCLILLKLKKNITWKININ